MSNIRHFDTLIKCLIAQASGSSYLYLFMPSSGTSCVFRVASLYVTTSIWVAEEWRSMNISARYWYSVSLFKLFLMKSFCKFESISSWSLISPNVVPSLPRAPRVPSFKLLLKYLPVMTSTPMHPAAVFDILQ